MPDLPVECCMVCGRRTNEASPSCGMGYHPVPNPPPPTTQVEQSLTARLVALEARVEVLEQKP